MAGRVLLAVLMIMGCVTSQNVNRQIRRLRRDVNQINQQLREIDDTIGELNERVQDLEMRQNTTHPVVFHAYVQEGRSIFVDSRNDIVVFQRVTLNTGHGYDQESGYFTAPVDGDYFFIVNIDVSTDHDCVRIRRNREDVVFTADRDDKTTTSLTGSGAVFLLKDETITVHHCGNKGFIEEGKESTFTGFLIAPAFV